jgi:hypothetical protein
MPELPNDPLPEVEELPPELPADPLPALPGVFPVSPP